MGQKLGSTLLFSGQGLRGRRGSTMEFSMLPPSPCPLHLSAGFLASFTSQPVIRHFRGNLLFLWASVSPSEAVYCLYGHQHQLAACLQCGSPAPGQTRCLRMFWDGAPKPVCLTRSPGHSGIPHGLSTVKATRLQNGPRCRSGSG